MYDSGRRDEALAETERTIALSPTNADAHHLKGKLLALAGQHEQALVVLETAVKLRPEDAVIREDLARLRGQKNR